MRRQLAALLALPLMMAPALAACAGDDDGGNGIASAGGDPAAEPGSDDGGGAGELTEDERYEAILAYTQCMRDHGIDMEDPQPGEPLRLQLRGDPEQAEAAREACQDLLPGGGPGGGEIDPEMQQRMLDFAQCMRDNGVANFPDPQPGGGVQIGPELADDPDFEAAHETCAEEVLGDVPGLRRNGGGGRA